MPDDNIRVIEEKYEIRFTWRERAFILFGFLVLFILNCISLVWIYEFTHPRSDYVVGTPSLRALIPEKATITTEAEPFMATQEPDLIDQLGEKYQLDPLMIRRLVFGESSGKPDAVSSCGARGLMQVTQPTWEEVCLKLGKEWSFSEAFDPAKNLEVGCYYLRYLHNWAVSRDYPDPLRTALLAYNCGMGRVSREEVPFSSERFADQILSSGPRFYDLRFFP